MNTPKTDMNASDFSGQIFGDRYRFVKKFDTLDDENLTYNIYSARDLYRKKDVTIKVWDVSKLEDPSSFRYLWQHEVRVLQRIRSYPGGREYLTSISNAWSQSNKYFLVLDTEGRQPITGNLRMNAPEVSPAVFWENARRLILALGILHDYGILHRHLEISSIYTADALLADYQLGCFGKSLFLRQPTSLTLENETQIEFSFRNDWLALGKLLCWLYGFNFDGEYEFNKISLTKKFNELKPYEKKFFNILVRPEITKVIKKDLLDCIESIQSNCSGGKNVGDYTLLYDAEKLKIIDADIYSNENKNHYGNAVDFVQSDLRFPKIVWHSEKHTPINQYALVGRKYTYRLKKSYHSRDWKLAEIDLIQKNKISKKRILAESQLRSDCINICNNHLNPKQADKLISASRTWEDALPSRTSEVFENDQAHCMYEGMVNLHILDVAIFAATRWKVSILNRKSSSEGYYIFSVGLAEDLEHSELYRLLVLGGRSSAFNEVIKDCISLGRFQWQMDEGVGRLDVDPVDWLLLSRNSSIDNKKIEFRSKDYIEVGEKVWIRPKSDVGTYAQLKKRKELLNTLKAHTELKEVLYDPKLLAQPCLDSVPVIGDVDDSKYQVLKQIFKTIPLYLLQGPPGVGKTFLLNEFVSSVLNQQPRSRLLLSAHGHDTVNQLMEKIVEHINTIPIDKRPLVIRTKSDQLPLNLGEYQLKPQAKKIISGVQASPCFESLPKLLQDKVNELSQKVDQGISDDRLADRSLRQLILRSANLVFSTSNSSELIDMVKIGAVFDWSVVEEAGRATANDMLAPLLLSHRRLLIGDPKQLPPFGESQFERLLKDISVLPRVKLLAEKHVGRQLFPRLSNDNAFIDQSNSRVEEVRNSIYRALLIFKSLHEENFSEKKSRNTLAGRLNIQHRMHPKIAMLVSDLFYGKSLKTSQEVARYWSKNSVNFIYQKNSDLLSGPISFINMSSVSKNSFCKEKLPAYYNEGEIEAVVKVLSCLESKKGNKATLKVISPYNEQVRRINERFNKLKNNKLKNIKNFELGQEIATTIDSFQGDEADIIIVSLVRNNLRAYRSGLGIIGNAQRMNVMLSRARKKLIIIGSLDFLSRKFFRGERVDKSDDLYFLKQFIKKVKYSNKHYKIKLTDYKKLR